LRVVKAARKTLDITRYVQSGFPIKRKIDEKTGLVLPSFKRMIKGRVQNNNYIV
jgi:hypothetical protein